MNQQITKIHVSDPHFSVQCEGESKIIPVQTCRGPEVCRLSDLKAFGT